MPLGRRKGTGNTRPPKETLVADFEELRAEGITRGLTKHIAAKYGVAQSTVSSWKQTYGLTKKRNTTKVNFPAQRLEEIEDEVFVPLLVGKEMIEVPGYTISKYGNVIGPEGRKKIWANQHGYPHTLISVDIGLFPHFEGRKNTSPDAVSDHVTKETKNIAIHRCVANAFLPRPIPECFEDIWDTLTEDQKQWVQSVYVVDHIDDDKGNPHVDNLQYLTVYENTHHVKRKRNESS